MMHIFRHLLVLVLVSSQVVKAQQVVMLEGQVLNDTIDRSNLNIVNISLEKGTTTSNSGVFIIPVRVGDTINISALQYESKQFAVTSTTHNRKKITLYLEPKTTELAPVEISNIGLTGDMDKDVKNIKLKRQIFARDLGLPENTAPSRTVEERRLYSASAGGGAPIALLNAISGRTKMLKKHLSVSRLQNKINQKRDQYSDSLFNQELKIPTELIDDFVYYIFEDKTAVTLVDTENILALFEFMLTKSSVYLELKESEGVFSKN